MKSDNFLAYRLVSYSVSIHGQFFPIVHYFLKAECTVCFRSFFSTLSLAEATSRTLFMC